jgi:hypothetical protein
MYLAASLTGCDSAPGPDDPKVKQAAQSQQESIKKGEDEANAAIKKTGGKNAPMLRISKPGANKGGPAPSQ